MRIVANGSAWTRALFRLWCCLTVVTACISTGGCTDQAANSPPKIVYATQYGLGPDKWATAWLLTRHGSSAAELSVVPSGRPVPAEAVLFDSPQAPIRRIGNRAAFEMVHAQLGKRDPAIDELAEIIHEMEINFWAEAGPPATRLIEDAFRNLQYRYGRESVTPDCYVAFFERVYQVLREQHERSLPINSHRLQLSCEDLVQVANREQDLVTEIPVVDLLGAMAAGRKVIFIDVREADEFVEGHIPGALNIPLRDVGTHLRERLGGADYVVSYCVKDFRGFEMAKALTRAGIDNSVIMRPYGIKGWISLGLPVAGQKGQSEAQASNQLRQCLGESWCIGEQKIAHGGSNAR